MGEIPQLCFRFRVFPRREAVRDFGKAHRELEYKDNFGDILISNNKEFLRKYAKILRTNLDEAMYLW